MQSDRIADDAANGRPWDHIVRLRPSDGGAAEDPSDQQDPVGHRVKGALASGDKLLHEPVRAPVASGPESRVDPKWRPRLRQPAAVDDPTATERCVT